MARWRKTVSADWFKVTLDAHLLYLKLTITTEETLMRLSAGMIAPPFETEDIFGNPISLEAYQGKGLMLSFFRNSLCAMCNLRVHHLIQKQPQYQYAGLEMVVVFESPKASVVQNVAKQNVPFPIIADPDATLYDLYSVESSQEKVMAPVDMDWRSGLIQEAEAIGYPLTREEGSNFFRLPAEFLIGPDGRIHSAFYTDVIGTHMAFDEIDQFLGQLTR